MWVPVTTTGTIPSDPFSLTVNRMAKFGSKDGKKFGSAAGRARIEERRARTAEVRASKDGVPTTQPEPADPKKTEKGTPKKKRS